MEKVIPKSKTKFLQNFFQTFRLEEAFVSSSRTGNVLFETGERYKLLPLREFDGLDKQLRTIRGSLKVAIAKRIDLKSCIKHEENKLNKRPERPYPAVRYSEKG